VNDMRLTIAPKSDQLNADDLIGTSLTIKVTKVLIAVNAPDQPVSIHFDGDNGKPYKPCKSMRRVLVKCWGPDANAYVGRSMSLFRDDDVLFGGQKVGGIRISHVSHIDKPITMALTATKAIRKPYTVHPCAAPPDRVADGVAELIARIQSASEAELQSITKDAAVIKKRKWLQENRPDLDDKIDAAINAALELFETDTGAEISTDPFDRDEEAA